jgi:hypothetical protein
MFSSVVNWINTIPITGVGRPFTIVGLMLLFAAILFAFWELIFVLARWFKWMGR